MKRFKKYVTGIAMILGVTIITENLKVLAQDDDAENVTWSGPYVWQGVNYELYQRTAADTGYIDEYTN